jgi:hypothetical protein
MAQREPGRQVLKCLFTGSVTNADQKAKIRSRMARTGESYATAKRAIDTERRDDPRTRRAAFTDEATGGTCELVIPSGGSAHPNDRQGQIGIAHPGCPQLADLAIELDAFYCRRCQRNGRISGAWCADIIRSAR